MAKLTQRQWDNIEKRLFAGESANSIAKDYPVSQQAISKKFSCSIKQIKDVANQIVDTEISFQKLLKSEQISCINLAEEMIAISCHMTTGAKYSAMTFSRLSKIANHQANMLHDMKPDPEQVTEIARLQHTANEASTTAVNLIKLNQTAAENSKQDSYSSMTEDDLKRELKKLRARNNID